MAGSCITGKGNKSVHNGCRAAWLGPASREGAVTLSTLVQGCLAGPTITGRGNYSVHRAARLLGQLLVMGGE